MRGAQTIARARAPARQRNLFHGRVVLYILLFKYNIVYNKQCAAEATVNDARARRQITV